MLEKMQTLVVDCEREPAVIRKFNERVEKKSGKNRTIITALLAENRLHFTNLLSVCPRCCSLALCLVCIVPSRQTNPWRSQ
jgi:hypothetical protein